jgi:hypothetical protein
MSQLDIKRTVENITKGKTNVYTPIVEAIVNSIDSIDQSGREDGSIEVIFKRSPNQPLNLESSALPDFSDIKVIDNGIGFTQENTDSFDTLFSNLKVVKGGKGYGRFTYLKYFEDVSVESVFKDSKKYKLRGFEFGFDKEIVVNDSIVDSDAKDTRTILYLNSLKDNSLDKRIETISRRLLEKLLIYFINDSYKCPTITIKEEGKNDVIILNDFLKKENGEIQLIASQEAKLANGGVEKDFQFKVFKIFYPHNKKSKISLAAHNREVTENPLSEYIPEFSDDFFDEFPKDDGTSTRKDYIVKTYVMGDYLDTNVSLERSDFNFNDRNNSFLYEFNKETIERKAAEITKELFKDEVKVRSEKKLKKIQEYVAERAPWHKDYLEDIDITSIPFHLDNKTIELEIQKVKYDQETRARTQIEQIINSPDTEIDESVNALIGQISKAKLNELAHYVALRKVILDLFKKSLEIKDDGKYDLESAVHSIIFPLKSDSDTTSYTNHNLWILDERLNFTDYVSSDKPLNGGKTERVDLIVFGKRSAFRGANEMSSPITIFEFKRPGREDFTDPSSKEDPVEQIIRYVNDINDGKYKTPTGRIISVGQNTPFYGYVVCDLTTKVTDWLLRNKDFTPMPDNKGWFKWYKNNNLYIEVLSWDKVLNDAELRNKIFFNKLGID